MKFKEKPKMGEPKSRPPGVLNPKQAARQMKEKYLRELDQRPEGPENETGYAIGQVEDAGRWAADWPDVLAVFAVKLAGADAEGVDVATLDAGRVEKLTAVFWDMTAITTQVETIDHPGSGEDDPGWTEYILHITITPKTADDMRTADNAVPDYDHVLFCDLRAEPVWVARQVAFVADACARAGIPFVTLDADLYGDSARNFGKVRVSSIPAWTIGPNGKKGKKPRQYLQAPMGADSGGLYRRSDLLL